MLPVQHAFNKATAGMLAGLPRRLGLGDEQSPLCLARNCVPFPSKRSVSRPTSIVRSGTATSARSTLPTRSMPRFPKRCCGKSARPAPGPRVFERSIANLHETVVSSILQDNRFLAALAIDIMDRNLYGGPTTARWWALTTTFRELLARPERSPEDVGEIGRILDYINGLYTVLAIFSSSTPRGHIVAVSRPGSGPVPRTSLNEDWVRQT